MDQIGGSRFPSVRPRRSRWFMFPVKVVAAPMFAFPETFLPVVVFFVIGQMIIVIGAEQFDMIVANLYGIQTEEMQDCDTFVLLGVQ